MNRVQKFITGFVALAATFVDFAAHAAPPPVEAYGQLPVITDIELSPDGRKYAVEQVYNGRTVLVIYDLYDANARPKLLSLEELTENEESLRFFRWANNDRLLVSVGFPGKRFGTEVVESRLLSVSADLSDMIKIPAVRLGPGKRSLTPGTVPAQIQDDIIHMLPKDPEHILMLYNRDGLGREEHAYKVNIYTGKYVRVERGGDSVLGYEADSDGNLRIRYRHRLGGGLKAYYRLVGEKSWEELYAVEKNKGRPFSIVGFVPGEPNRAYAFVRNDKRRRVIATFDLETKTLEKVLYSHPKVDISGLFIESYSARPVGYGFSEHTYKVKYFDPLYDNAIQRAAAEFPGVDVSIISTDRLKKMFAVRLKGAGHSGAFYLYIKDHDLFQKIGDRYPRIPAHVLLETEPISYIARDGLMIPGYLTRPRGEGPFPTVVMPHGGPTARSYLDFNYRVQFLASRGYAVLQPNFRGSSGYGLAFQTAGYQEWGLAMQDDVTDGVKHLIDTGVADPKRICIVGGSYGGYVALMGAVKTPDLYQCAVAFAPVTDIRLMLSNEAKFRFQDTNRPSVGSKYGDSGKLKDTSPANRVEEIKIPILLVHGDKDRVVSIEHSKKMAKRLKRHKKDYKFVIQKEGDHFHSLEAHRIEYLRELETFLGEHLN